MYTRLYAQIAKHSLSPSPNFFSQLIMKVLTKVAQVNKYNACTPPTPCLLGAAGKPLEWDGLRLIDSLEWC